MEFQIVAGELCLDFVNTLDYRLFPDRRKELLPTYQDLADWAAQAGSISATQRTALLREAEAQSSSGRQEPAIRRSSFESASIGSSTVLARNRRPPADDLVMLNRYRVEAFSNEELKATRRGFRLEWKDEPLQLDSVLWPIVQSASALLTSPDLQNVHECDMETCRWLFVDRSKNHRRRWCDMKICGNRAKARTFYLPAKSWVGRCETVRRRQKSE